ncbi:nitric oxide reductase transcriptional regulator NorR [Vibrio algarum]|uniref:Nitric oxide reductase transcriptional regulator NorR n=1 Tax=Vibrio algarum TaxID=3020714 RepID=A0ABT4YWL2_9VIBR|nr:nitric oxide reductase transcriptional regulator NorR [Vibrio sp. KJ40-1]MDB1125966.1 nitric oxide reductase transcriptional regulator NorR [Vibrio sp. KJ40-1]
MSKLNKEWIKIALDLTSVISDQDRFDRLLSSIREVLKCDASALLYFQDQQFIPLAINGLYDDVLGRRFDIQQHPRLEAIARAGDVVRFPPDSDLPDPYDGLIPEHEHDLRVHSCIGLPLLINDRLIGAVTIDAFDPKQFDSFRNQDLRVISALAATSLNTALLMEQLENQVGIEASPAASRNKSIVPSEIIGNSEVMQELKSHISAVANTDLSVLIMGETGVGKELVAAALHENSDRVKQNLVYLNCAALPESVAESELFGHVKGAFTGAISNRKGKFELADNGTLFLDEIGELSLALQAKLLRALQYGDIQRVGDDRNIKVNARIVAATNRVMHEEVKAGRFRSDLYHRLSVFPIFVPPLRERAKDITLLSGFFAERCQHKLGVKNIKIDPQTHLILKNHSWQGNVRELEHAINRAAVLARSESRSDVIVLLPKHFSLEEQDNPVIEPSINRPMSAPSNNVTFTPTDLKSATDEFQFNLINQAYIESGNNWAAAARLLKVDAGNLHRLMKRLKMK